MWINTYRATTSPVLWYFIKQLAKSIADKILFNTNLKTVKLKFWRGYLNPDKILMNTGSYLNLSIFQNLRCTNFKYVFFFIVMDKPEPLVKIAGYRIRLFLL